MVYIPRRSQAKSSERHRCTQLMYSRVHQLFAPFYLFFCNLSFLKKLLLSILKNLFLQVKKALFESLEKELRGSCKDFHEVIFWGIEKKQVGNKHFSFLLTNLWRGSQKSRYIMTKLSFTTIEWHNKRKGYICSVRVETMLILLIESLNLTHLLQVNFIGCRAFVR